MSGTEPTSAFPDAELLALLQDAAVSPETIVQEMQFAEVTPYPAEALAAARQVVTAFDESCVPAFESLPPPLRALVLDQAVHVRAIDFLNARTLSKDKGIAKDSKRALFLLKTRGVVFQPAKPANAPAAPPPFVSEELPTFMSSVDGYGERVIFFSAHRRSGIDVAQIVLSDETGIVNVHLAQLSRKEYRRFVQGLTKTRTGILAEVPKAYGRGLVTAALDLNVTARKPIPPAFNDIAFILGSAVPPQPSPGHALPPPENAADALQRAPELLEIEVLRTWMPPEETLQPIEARVQEIAASSLYIDGGQRLAARRDVLRSAAREYWNEAHRALWRERLYDTAYLLNQDGRKEQAGWALATAIALGSETPFDTIPFCLAFFEEALKSGQPGTSPAAPDKELSLGSLVLPA